MAKYKISLLNKSLAFVILILVVSLTQITPVTSETVASQVKKTCDKNQKEKEACYAREFSKISEANGYEFGFDTLFALQKIDEFAKGCHLIAHGIGEGAYKRSPSDWQSSVQNINKSCTYGALHGIIESYVASMPQGSLTKQTVKETCGTNPLPTCVHIMGHLLLVETVVDIDKALDFCQVFGTTIQSSCYNGVFMEYETALNLISHGYASKSWLDWSSRLPELEKLCRNYKDQFAIACWTEIAYPAVAKFNSDPSKVFGFCETAQIGEGRKECKRNAVGILTSHARFDLEYLRSMCTISQPFDLNFESDCYGRIVAVTMNSLPNMFDKVKEFCLSIPNQYIKACTDQINISLRNQEQSTMLIEDL